MIVATKPNYHALVKLGNRYTFRPDPDDRRRVLVSFVSVGSPSHSFTDVSIRVVEGRKMYEFLIKGLGYERP